MASSQTQSRYHPHILTHIQVVPSIHDERSDSMHRYFSVFVDDTKLSARYVNMQIKLY